MKPQNELSEYLIEMMFELGHCDRIDKKEQREKIDKFIKDAANKPALTTIGLSSGITPLMAACQLLDEDLVRALIEAGSDVNQADRKTHKTPIFYLLNHICIEDPKRMARRIPILAHLLSSGADPNATSSFTTPLSLASACICENSGKIVSLLLNTIGVCVDIRDYLGRTPLMIAKSGEILKELLKAGAQIDTKDNSGQTAFMHQIYCGQIDLGRFLSEKGANIYERDFEGRTAIELLSPSLKQNFHLKHSIASIYLTPLYVYFKNSTAEKIKSDIGEFISDPENESKFPIRPCHLIAINFICNLKLKNNRFFNKLMVASFAENLSFLSYFKSLEFREKIWADIIHELNEENVNLDGQTLLGRRLRAKTQQELDKFNELGQRLCEKAQLAKDFDEACLKATTNVYDDLTSLINEGTENFYSEEVLVKLKEFLDKFLM